MSKAYIISNQGSSYQNGFSTYIYGEPRMYGLSVRYRFGDGQGSQMPKSAERR